MFNFFKRLIGGGIRPAGLLNDCENLLEMVLNDEEQLEKFKSVRIISEDPDGIDDWKEYFYPNFKMKIESPSKKVQWLNLRKMLIQEIETLTTFESIMSVEFSRRESDQLAREYMKYFKEGMPEIRTIKDFKQFMAQQYVLSELSMVCLRNILLKDFNDGSGFFNYYWELHSNMMEQGCRIRLKEKSDSDTAAEQVLAQHTARMVAGVKQKICKGEPWVSSDGGIPLANEEEVREILRY